MKTGGAIRKPDDDRQWCQCYGGKSGTNGPCRKLANWQVTLWTGAVTFVCTTHKDWMRGMGDIIDAESRWLTETGRPESARDVGRYPCPR